jgi:hypothetical protein
MAVCDLPSHLILGWHMIEVTLGSSVAAVAAREASGERI